MRTAWSQPNIDCDHDHSPPKNSKISYDHGRNSHKDSNIGHFVNIAIMVAVLIKGTAIMVAML